MHTLLSQFLDFLIKVQKRLGWTRLCLLIFLAGAVLFLGINAGWSTERSLLGEGGSTERLHRSGRVGTWFGVLAAVVVAAGMLLTSRWWLRKSEVRPIQSREDYISPRWFLIGILAAACLGGGLSWSRMDASVYNDEEYSLRTYIRGRYQQADNGDLQFKPVTWAHTVWSNPIGNNHLLFSILSRISLETWKTCTGAGPRGFSETAFRFPSWLAGLGSIMILGILLRRAGYARAGLFAAFLAAVHPWFLRYIAEGRGYSLMFFFLILGWYFLLRALQENRWIWWIIYGLAQVLMLASYAGSLYVVAAQNSAALVFCLWGWMIRHKSPLVAVRLITANMITVGLLCLFKGPWLIYQLDHMSQARMNSRVGSGYLADFWCYLSSGMMFRSDTPDNPLHITIERLASEGWPAETVVWVLLPALVGVGVLRLVLRGSSGVLIAMVCILPAPLGYFHAWVSETFLFIWYLIFAIPGYLVLLSLGLTWPLSAIKSPNLQRFATPAWALVCVGLFAAFTWPQTRVIRSYSKENTKAAITFMRGYADPTGLRDASNMLTGAFWSEASFYDPHARFLREPSYFADIIREAYAKKLPLYIVHGNREVALKRNPTNFVFVNNPALFEQVAEFPGLEESLTTVRVVRYTGADPEPHMPDPMPER